MLQQLTDRQINGQDVPNSKERTVITAPLMRSPDVSNSVGEPPISVFRAGAMICFTNRLMNHDQELTLRHEREYSQVSQLTYQTYAKDEIGEASAADSHGCEVGVPTRVQGDEHRRYR